MDISTILNFLNKNKEWVFSGIGVFVLGGIITFLRKIICKGNSKKADNEMVQINYENSSGTQIGIQNNHYREKGILDGKATDGNSTGE